MLFHSESWEMMRRGEGNPRGSCNLKQVKGLRNHAILFEISFGITQKNLVHVPRNKKTNEKHIPHICRLLFFYVVVHL